MEDRVVPAFVASYAGKPRTGARYVCVLFQLSLFHTVVNREPVPDMTFS